MSYVLRMFRILIKFFFIIVISLFVSNCSNIKIVNISEDVKRFDKFNSGGNYQKSYYMKYNKTFNQWFRANCYNNICEYSKLALIQIENLSKDNQEQSVDNQEENLVNPVIEEPLQNNQCNDGYEFC